MCCNVNRRGRCDGCVWCDGCGWCGVNRSTRGNVRHSRRGLLGRLHGNHLQRDQRAGGDERSESEHDPRKLRCDLRGRTRCTHRTCCTHRTRCTDRTRIRPRRTFRTYCTHRTEIVRPRCAATAHLDSIRHFAAAFCTNPRILLWSGNVCHRGIPLPLSYRPFTSAAFREVQGKPSTAVPRKDGVSGRRQVGCGDSCQPSKQGWYAMSVRAGG